MKLWNRESWCSLAFAWLIASWCTGWLWFLLALTRPLPGIYSLESDLGALELLELPLGRPYSVALVAIFLLCLMPPLLLNALRGWWDSKGRALDAMSWPLRSVRFWLPCLLWLIAGVALSPLFDEGNIAIVATSISLLAMMAVPFFCLNTTTLDTPFPSRWWRPGWPGWKALSISVVLWTAYTLAAFALEQVIGISLIPWLTLLLLLLSELMSAFVLIFAIAIWLNRGRWQAVQSDLGRLKRGGFIAEYAWQSLAIALIVFVLAVPILVTAIEAIFVIPQYEIWAEGNGMELPFVLRLQADIYRGVGSLLLVLAVPFGLYLGLAVGRLMRQHGVRKENRII